MAMNTKAQIQLLRGNLSQLKNLTLEEGALFYGKDKGVLFSGGTNTNYGFIRNRDARRDGLVTTIYCGPDGSNDNYGFTSDDAVHCIARAIDVSRYINVSYGVRIVLLGDVNWIDDEYKQAYTDEQGNIGIVSRLFIESSTDLSQPAHINLSHLQFYATSLEFTNIVIDSIDNPYPDKGFSSDHILYIIGSGSIYFTNVTVNNNNYAHGIYIGDNSYFWMNNSIYNAGDSVSHLFGMHVSLGSTIEIVNNSVINGSFSIGTLYATTFGHIHVSMLSGTCTGRRFTLSKHSYLDTDGEGPNAVPGTEDPYTDASSSYM